MIDCQAIAERPIRLGVVGAGRWGRNIIKTVVSLPSVELAGVVSCNQETKNLVPAGCPVFSSWEEFISQVPMDGVVIATPPATHCIIAEASIQSGLHVMIEKPLSLSLKEAENIWSLGKRSQRVVMTEFTQLFNPKFRTLQAYLPLIKGIHFILTRAGNFGPYRSDTPVLWDWGAHDLSMLIALTESPPQTINAKRIAQGDGKQGDESIWKITCSFPSGIETETVIGNMFSRCRQVAVIGSAGTLLFDDVGDVPVSYFPGHHKLEFPNGLGEQVVVEDMTPPLAQAILEFGAAIRNNDITNESARLGVEVVRQLSICSQVN